MLKYKNVIKIMESKKYPPVNHDYWHIKIDNDDYLIHILAYQNNSYILNVIQKKPELLFFRNKQGLPVGHILAQQNNFLLLQKIIDINPIVLKATDSSSSSVLFHCLYNIDFIQKNVSNKMLHINHNDIHNHTMLSKCIVHGYLDTFILLKENGAQVKYVNINLYTLVLLHCNDNILQNKWFQILLNFEDPNRISMVQSPLNYASSTKNLWAIKWLIDIGADINHNDSSNNIVILTWIKNGYIDLILKHFNKINFNVTTVELNTPLHLYLITTNDIDSQFAFKLFTKMHNKNFCNIYNNTIFHILPVRNLLQFSKVGFINIWQKNKDNVTVYQKWNDYIQLNPADKEKLQQLWWKGFNDDKDTAYTTFDKLKTVKNNIDLSTLYNSIQYTSKNNFIPNLETNNDETLFTNFYQHIGLYNSYYLHKYDVLCIPKMNKYNFENNLFDTPIQMNIKALLESFKESSEYFDNKIVWVSKDCNFIPLLPNYYKQDKIYFYNIHIVSPIGNHANLLLIDMKLKLIEIFEPHGYKNNDIVQTLYQHYTQHPQLTTFDLVNDKVSTNFNGFQTFENMLNEINIGDVPGYCLAWSYWYLELRAKNYGVHPIDIYNKSIQEILNNCSIRDYIRAYSNKLTFYKNNMFLKLIDKDLLKRQTYNDKEAIYNKQIISELLKPFIRE